MWGSHSTDGLRREWFAATVKGPRRALLVRQAEEAWILQQPRELAADVDLAVLDATQHRGLRVVVLGRMSGPLSSCHSPQAAL